MPNKLCEKRLKGKSLLNSFFLYLGSLKTTCHVLRKTGCENVRSMKKIPLLFSFCLFFLTDLSGQTIKSFSEEDGAFLKEFRDFFTASKRKDLVDLYEVFAAAYTSGGFSEEQKKQIRLSANEMLAKRMSATTHFKAYLQALLHFANGKPAASYYESWESVRAQLMAAIQKRQFKPYLTYLEATHIYFSDSLINARSSVKWKVVAEEMHFAFIRNEGAFVFKKATLTAFRAKDSLSLKNTEGMFFPNSKKWEGQGGRADWQRLGLDPEVYVTLQNYHIDLRKGLYQADSATLNYPLFLGGRKVPGKFEDKVSKASSSASFPRFTSYVRNLRFNDLGEGIRFQGGFRLKGTTVYGFGDVDQPALLTVFDGDGKQRFRAKGASFTIRREEQILAEAAETTLYYGEQDSIYHPAVNMRFNIEQNTMALKRGTLATGQNPFFFSGHQVMLDADDVKVYFSKDSLTVGERSAISGRSNDEVVFESLHFFDKGEYFRIQNIASYNPIAVIKRVSEEVNSRVLDADYLAGRMSPGFTVENILTLLYELEAKGFVHYIPERHEVEVRDKIFHYADAAAGKEDYDLLRIVSKTRETNAVCNLKTGDIRIFGVKNLRFSQPRRVALIPGRKEVVLKYNRGMDFDGHLFAGRLEMFGKGFHFDYERFQIVADSIQFLDIYLPNGEVDEKGRPKAFAIGSRLENLSGVLLIDAPSNKSGKEDIGIFPSFQSKGDGYLYFESDSTFRRAYKRDSFYFRLNSFGLNHLTELDAGDLDFTGTLVSAGIFQDIDERLSLQEDMSLGFVHEVPQAGYGVYGGKGLYKGTLSLSNRGLLGEGSLSYLGASIASEDFAFRPHEMTSTAREFALEEDRNSNPPVPAAYGEEVSIQWKPLQDSLYIRSKEKPFELFGHKDRQLHGTLVLTPGGLKGKGEFIWEKAKMSSPLFSFGAASVQADTANLNIWAFDSQELALKTRNVRAVVDFDRQQAVFEGNEEHPIVSLPFNQYEISMGKFIWNMEEGKLAFESRGEGKSLFYANFPGSDSLHFYGTTAHYDLETNILGIEGVERIQSADAFIYLDDGFVTVHEGGLMDTLYNTRIVADTASRFHTINRAKVVVKGKKDYWATGYYEYNVGKHQQEILFSDILGTRVGKGARHKKRVATRGRGEVKETDHFYIDHKTEFQGSISLSSDKKELHFEGFARFEANLPTRQWFSVDFDGVRSDLLIQYDKPKNFDGDPLATGLFLSKETARIYPRVMAPLYYRKDRPILPVTGVVRYDQGLDRFFFGDSLKVRDQGVYKGNLLVFYNANGRIDAEGKFELGQHLNYISVEAAGKARTEVGIATDTLVGGPLSAEVSADLMLAIDFPMPEEMAKMLLNDLKASSFDATRVVYAKDISFYRKGLAELFPMEEKEVVEAIDQIALNNFTLTRKVNKHTLLFGKVPMKWDPDYQSFVSTKSILPLISINGEPIGVELTSYVEIKMPTNDDDRLYVYLRAPGGFYYFFGYKQGIMNVVSNNTKFNDYVINMKDKERRFKMPDGAFYEIQPVNEGTAEAFVRRIKAVQ